MREEEKKRSSQDSSMKRFFRKRWVFPAIYIASAAIILTAVLWYTNGSNVAKQQKKYDYNATDIAGKKYNQQPSIEVNRLMENIEIPVMNPETAVIQTPFYDFDGKPEAQEASLIMYNNSYHPNTGIDYKMKNGETFDVVAALSGKVTKVQEDELLGNVIVIQHDEGIVTQYSSVKDYLVEEGTQIKQGQVIAKAGQSLFNEDAGVHVHFEIRKDNKPVNPSSYFKKPISSLQEEKPADDEAIKEDESKKEATGDESDKEMDEDTSTDKNKDQDSDTPEDSSKQKEDPKKSSTNPS